MLFTPPPSSISEYTKPHSYLTQLMSRDIKHAYISQYNSIHPTTYIIFIPNIHAMNPLT